MIKFVKNTDTTEITSLDGNTSYPNNSTSRYEMEIIEGLKQRNDGSNNYKSQPSCVK